MFRKIFSLLLISFILLNVWFVSAELNNTSWNDTLFEDKWLEFKAKFQDGVVYMSWNRFINDNKDDTSDYFKYYKIVRSTTNSSPVYPDDWFIKYYENIDKREYSENHPKEGTSFYRVCAITKANNRHCSNVVKLHIELEEKKFCTEEYSPVCWYKDWNYKTYSNKCHLTNDKAYYKYHWKCEEKSTWTTNDSGLSNTLKIKSKGIINRFIKKIESKWYSNTKNIEVIDAIIIKLNDLEDKKPKLSNLLHYLIDLLKDKKEKYQNDFSDIEDIFDID